MRAKSTLLLLFAVLSVALTAAPLAAQTLTFNAPAAGDDFGRCATVFGNVTAAGFTMGFDTTRIFVGTGAPGDSTRRDIAPNTLEGTSPITFTFDLTGLPNQPGPSNTATFTVIVRDIASGNDVTQTVTIDLVATPSIACARALVELINTNGEFECPVYTKLRDNLLRASVTSGTLRCQLIQGALTCVRELVRSEVPGGLRDPVVSADPLLGNFRWRRLIWGTPLTRSAQAHARLLEDELVALLAFFGC
jgi:hypothetical protein